MAKSRSKTNEQPAPRRPAAPFSVNGWSLWLHPCILDQIESLMTAVEKELARGADPGSPTANMKVLASIHQILFTDVPQDPGDKRYRQGKTLGKGRAHWFRAKFGNGRFRLFYRYSTSERAILYAWVNDQSTLRTYGSRTDAYAVFAGMLNAGNPPDDWDELLAAAKASAAARRTKRIRR